MGVGVVEEEKSGVGGGEEAGDEVVVEAVDVFEVPGFLYLFIWLTFLSYQRSELGGNGSFKT